MLTNGPNEMLNTMPELDVKSLLDGTFTLLT